MSRPVPPLLALAEGRRVRPRKTIVGRPREMVLHLAVVDMLTKLGHPKWRWTHFPAGEAREVRTGVRLKRMGLKPGWPDLILVAPGGRFYGLELKREGEDLTDAQSAFRLWAIAEGVRTAVVCTFDEAFATLAGWGAIRRLGAQAEESGVVETTAMMLPASKVVSTTLRARHTRDPLRQVAEEGVSAPSPSSNAVGKGIVSAAPSTERIKDVQTSLIIPSADRNGEVRE